MADLAEQDGDAVVEIEARRQALQHRPSAQRRAHLAVALLHSGQAAEAAALLPGENSSAFEHVARGLALLQDQDTAAAKGALADALQRTSELSEADDRWLQWLRAGLAACGEPRLALDACRWVAARRPADPQAILDLGEAYAACGDHLLAADQSRLALALESDSERALRVLALNLQAAGRFAEALPHWNRLAADGAEARASLADCALRAGENDLALETAQSMLQAEPGSTKALALLGRSLVAKGDCQAARDLLEKATQTGSVGPEAWVALAECKMAEGDQDGAAETLSSAIQLDADNPGLAAAWSRWLARQGRWTEAIEEAERAVRLDSTDVESLVQCAELHMQQGHGDRAKTLLLQASRGQPENWRIHEATVRLSYAQGDLEDIRRLAREAPPSAPATALLSVAALVLQAAEQAGSPDPARIVRRAKEDGAQPSIPTDGIQSAAPGGAPAPALLPPKSAP